MRNRDLYSMEFVPLVKDRKALYLDIKDLKSKLKQLEGQEFVSFKDRANLLKAIRTKRNKLKSGLQSLIMRRLTHKGVHCYEAIEAVCYGVHLYYARNAYGKLRMMIQAERENYKIVSFRACRHRGAWSTIGLVHQSKGEVMEASWQIKKNRTTQDKIPKSKDNHVAVEIEFVCSYNEDDVADAILKHELEDYVTLKEDGSVCAMNEDFSNCYGECCECGAYADGEECQECICTCGLDSEWGHELAVLMTEKEYPKIVKRVCIMLKELGAYVNKTCGLHVHLDMRSRNVELAYKNLYNAQGLLMSLVPRDRRRNKYCKPLSHGILQNALPGDRYYAINSLSLEKHNTLEVRLHQGSIETSRICNWITLLVKLVEAKRVNVDSGTITKVSKSIKLNKKLKTYLKRRVAKFKVAA